MSAPHTLAPGNRLGPYEVIESLGSGGMGEVYRARDPRLGRDVAIKILRGQAVSGEEARRRFEREARAVAALSHPNILAVHDIGSESERLYIVMELLEGETLRDRLGRGGLPWRKAVDVAAQIATGLAAAHAKGIVHRDVKPSNVFLTSDGRAKVLDFGLAKLRPPVDRDDDASSTLSQTQPSRVVGTAGYMSPELVAGKPADARSDMFALGCVLHEMLSGRGPFARPTAVETMAAILNEEPPELEQIPPDLRRLIAHCLEKDPEARFQSARDLTFDLRALLEPSGASGTPGRTGARPRRRPLAWLATGALVGALVVVSFLALQPGRERGAVAQSYVLPPEGIVFATGADFYGIAAAGGDVYASGSAGHLAVSPDGRQIAFVARPRDGRAALWIRPLDDLSARRLVGTEGARQPFWSPDGRFLGFFAEGQLKKVAVAGGAPQVLCRASLFTQRGAWSPKGVIVFGLLGGPLRRVSDAGGRPEPVTELNASRREEGHVAPVFLPDGRRFLYFAASASGNSGLYAASLESKESTFVANVTRVEIDAVAGQLLYLRGSTLVAAPFDLERLLVTGEPTLIADQVAVFSASANGVLAYARAAPRQLVWFDRGGRDLGTIPVLRGRFEGMRLSHDGRRLVAMETDPETGTKDVWVYDLVRRVGTRLTSDPSEDRWPVWSPDDRWIAFGSTRTGNYELYRIASSGAGTEELLFASSDEGKNATSWSSDGRQLVFNTSGVEQDLWILSLPERTPVRLEAPFKEFDGQISPDGRWIAYCTAETRRPEIYVRSVPTSGAKWSVSTGGGLWPRWRADGKELFYLGTDRRKVMAVEVKTGRSFEAGVPRALFDVPSTGRGWLTVTPDGQRFLFVTPVPEEGARPIVLVQNWPALLGK